MPDIRERYRAAIQRIRRRNIQLERRRPEIPLRELEPPSFLDRIRRDADG